MASKKRTVLPIILMVDDKSPAGTDDFVLALRQLTKEDIPDKVDKKAVFEAGLLINPVDYLPGFQRRKGQKLTTDALANEVKGSGCTYPAGLHQYEIIKPINHDFLQEYPPGFY